jgi:hypothetical protein
MTGFLRIIGLEQFTGQNLQLLGPEDVKALHIQVAKDVKAEAMEETGVSPAEVLTIVDGRQGAAEETVKPYGVIAYRFGSIAEVAIAIRDELISRSPTRSGRYRSSWFAIIRGEPVGWEQLDSVWRQGDEIWITNDQPYHRILTTGTAVDGPFHKFRAPTHITSSVALWARQRFGNLARISDTFVDLNTGGSGKAVEVPWRLRRSQGRKGRQAGDRINYPAVIIASL